MENDSTHINYSSLFIILCFYYIFIIFLFDPLHNFSLLSQQLIEKLNEPLCNLLSSHDFFNQHHDF
jgi:cellulose synthase/poly-beta-1,6-N-acetylglucosamine synthase-like glycosyltransferase